MLYPSGEDRLRVRLQTNVKAHREEKLNNNTDHQIYYLSNKEIKSRIQSSNETLDLKKDQHWHRLHTL